MPTTKVSTFTSRVRLGLGRADITPPVGIYHPVWGAARHDRSTGVHKPLWADVMAIAPLEEKESGTLRLHADLVRLAQEQHQEMLAAVSQAASVPLEDTVLSYSHTHASGWFDLSRVDFPGGEMIPGYLQDLEAKLVQASAEAVEDMQEVWITYAVGRCDMAVNRDYWDEAYGHFVCGYNPDQEADDTVLVGRISDAAGKLLGTIVNYACHPTTLAWENALISPDYVGAMREKVEEETGAPCIYAQGACGDLAPRYGYTGDTAVADQNGRWLAYGALSALESMGPAGMDFEYQGPVISGATLGTWGHVELTEERLAEVSAFSGGTYTVDLPRKPKPDVAALRQEREEWLEKQRAADEQGDAIAARDYGARAERARRWIERVRSMSNSSASEAKTFAFEYSVHRLGDAAWVTCGGEPYNLLQRELRARFPGQAVLFSPVSGSLSAAYLLPSDRYGVGLYQEEPSILAPGCLEQLIDAITERIDQLFK